MSIWIWILLAIIYVLSIFIVGFIAQQMGIEQGEEKATQSPSSFYQTVQSSEFTKADLDALDERISFLYQNVQDLSNQAQVVPLATPESSALSDAISRIKALEEREQTYQERFRRVEKKAGMNV